MANFDLGERQAIMNEISAKIDEWLSKKQTLALATVVDTWGSAPRPVGAKMLINAEMSMLGSVSGGCVETAVIEEALAMLQDHHPRLLEFGVSDDTAWSVGLACGGKIAIYLEVLDTAWWEAFKNKSAEQHPILTITILTGEMSGQKVMVNSEGHIHYASTKLPSHQQAALLAVGQQAFAQGKSLRTKVDEMDVLLDFYQPQPKLIIVGAVHIAIPLKDFAQRLGFQVTLIDPRKVFASPERFPDMETILYSYPDKAFAQLGLDENTFIAVLSHDPKIDDPALITALDSSVPYIGVLSSRRTHEKRLERLTNLGVNPALFERIRTPIGLNIGAKTPEEIALCIMAEIVAVRNGALQ